MRDWLILLTIRTLSLTPLRFNQALGRLIGELSWRLDSREKRISLVNLELCFPDKSREWREQTARESLGHMAATMLEAPRLWRLGRKRITALVDNPEALRHALAAYDRGHGLVIASPHLGNWEFVGQLFGAHTSMTSLFRPPRIERIAGWLREARQSTGAVLVPTDATGVRALARALNAGQCSGILPDQEPEAGSGVFAPFFGIPAYTMYLLPRLVMKKQTPVLFVFAERLRNGKYRINAQWQNPELYADKIEVACTAMNRQLETLVRRNPAQYNWAYKRFKTQPDGRDFYREALRKA